MYYWRLKAMNRRDLLKLPAMAGVLQATGLPVAGSPVNNPASEPKKAHSSCDVAAYYWPAYHDEPLWRPFFRGTEGEWEIIRNAKPKWEGHNQPRVPLWGFEDESDPRVMAKKIRAAAAHSVNVLVFDWYWYRQAPFLEQTIDEGFLKADNNHLVNFYLMWANHDATTLWDLRRSAKSEVIWPGSVDRKNFDAVAERVIEKYFHHPSYYRIEGKPVFSIYDISNPKGRSPGSAGVAVEL
jgi:hypothetical protein